MRYSLRRTGHNPVQKAVAALLLVLLTACGDRGGGVPVGNTAGTDSVPPADSIPADDSSETADPFADSTMFVSRDSAGINIVESLDSLWRDNGWWVDTNDVLLSIGVALGDTTYELRGANNVVRLPNGGIALAESNEAGIWIKVFDAAGRFRQRIGRRGEEPGEFNAIAVLRALPGDSIFVYDNQLHRVTVFRPDGRVARVNAVPVLAAGTNARVLPFATGLIGGVPVVPPASNPLIVPQAPSRRDSLAVVSIDTAAVGMARILVIPDAEVVVSGDVALRHRFSQGAFWAATGDRFFAASNERFEIGEYDPAGSLKRVFRAPAMNVTLEPDSVTALRDEWRAALREPSPASTYAMLRLEHARFPEFRPRFRGITVDGDGNLWLQVPPSAGGPNDRLVIDKHGRLLGTVQVPASRTIRAIGDDWILVSKRDRIGVEYVEVLRLVKDR